MQTRQQAVDRAIVLGILAFRSLFEGAAHAPGGPRDDAEAMAAGVTDWLRDAGLWRALVGPERAMLELPPLSWGRERTLTIQRAGLEESIVALLWSLRVIELPAFDQSVDADALLRRLPFMSDSPFVTREGMAPREEYASMVAAVELHPRELIQGAQGAASLYFWRARSHALVRAGRLERSRLEDVLREGAPRSRELGLPVDPAGEFLVFGTRYADLDDARFARCSLIAESRTRALRWLCGDGSWIDVDMST